MQLAFADIMNAVSATGIMQLLNKYLIIRQAEIIFFLRMQGPDFAI